MRARPMRSRGRWASIGPWASPPTRSPGEPPPAARMRWRRRSAGPSSRMVWGAATEPFVLLLLGAGLLAVALGEVRDGLLILAGLGPIVGADVVTEYRGERALEALRDASAPRARVRRDGAVGDVDAAGLVPGDIVLLRAGDVVPADLRLILRADRLLLDRSALTGESVPEPGSVEADPAAAPLADRHAMAYAGTCVVGGRGEGVVVAIGAGLGGRADRRRAARARPAPVAAPGGARPAGPDPARRRDRADRDHDRARVRARPAGRGEPARRDLGGDRRDPGGAAGPARGDPRPGRLPAAQARRPGSPPERRGDARRDRPDRDRQDRDADPATGSRWPR